ncbi:MAG: hypothetical protein J07HX5_00866 [halophilic archaeon J07HX5]|nr:MAG: hypothetical protein J07HX5_00866 [halophilic archaeon J07HX5]
MSYGIGRGQQGGCLSASPNVEETEQAGISSSREVAWGSQLFDRLQKGCPVAEHGCV